MISVIIPAYNAGTTIVGCINSVLKQTRVDLIEEVIVVDDGSTDNTVDKIKAEVNSNLVKIISKENGGVSTARNMGISKAVGKWIALLDADDIWDMRKIEKQVEVINKYPEIVFIGTNRNNENVKFGKMITTNLFCLNLRNILFKCWPHTSTVLIQRKVFNEVGMFDESMKYAEDGNLWNRIVVKYPLYYITESLEVAGGGKRQYGEKGLSSNLKGMYEGNVKNLSDLKKHHEIRLAEYMLWRLYFWIKHVKRIILTSLANRRNS